ncbi:hypothetical protein HPULCUR_004483 [Helicostylum pulchrum]|uniref:Sequence orphan n=1 Tax=Helicostylum pulchrum TaxID=562976 RepID=A0ABP9XWC1_9FUNG
MNITRSNIRSVVLHVLLLIFLAILQTKADEIELVQFDYFHNAPNLDPMQSPSVDDYNEDSTVDSFDMDYTTTHTKFIRPTLHIKETITSTTTITTTTKKSHKRSTGSKTKHTTMIETIEPIADSWVESYTTPSATDEVVVSIADPLTETTLFTETYSPSDSLLVDVTTSTFYTPTATLPLSILTSVSTPTPSIFINTTSSNTTIQYTNTSDPLVQYDLECRADDVFCSKVSRAVGAAIDEFTRTCANDTLGWGTPTSQFTLPFEDGADLNYVYPQALAKQLAPYSSTSVWAKYDIEIEINHDVYLNGIDFEQETKDGWNGTGTPRNGNFWFFNDSGSSNISTTSANHIQSHQVDFRYVVLHELLHGLGFLSSWAAYFWTDASPFRTLIEGIIDPLELQLVTPGPYWYINQDTGPAYVTGFQPTMIFDKYLVNLDTKLNVTHVSPLSDLAFEMQDFCVQNNNAFIVNFIKSFNAANQSTTAHRLWISMSQPETVRFQFEPPTVADSSYNLIPYLNQTYRNITLLTGGDLFERSSFEQIDPTLNRPGLMISHLDDQYAKTPDFLMTQQYHHGKTLEELVKNFYDAIPIIKYNTTASNNTIIEEDYRSPIGPGILRILDSIGYSTVLTKTNYTTDGNVKTPKSRSVCDDSNTNHGQKPSPTATSTGNKLSLSSIFIIITFFLVFLYF